MSLKLLEDYSSSSEEEPPPKKRLPPPRLPVYSLCRSISREHSNTELEKHQNRKRTFPHEAGNWATYVAIDFPVSLELQDYFDEILQLLSCLELKPIENVHVSLTRVVIIRHHWISDFTETIKDNLHSTRSFSLILTGLTVYVNDDSTRTFVALQVECGKGNLNELVNILDKCLAQYSLPTFYNDRSFHLSFLWGLGNIKKDIEACISKLPKEALTRSFCSAVNSCFCKTGNKYFVIPFS